MPSKAKKSKGNQEPQTEQERHIERETKRLRERAEGNLLHADDTQPNSDTIPAAFRKCDGADILKRNSARKKKYLFVFPGTISFPPGSKIGALSGLDTRTPVLYVEYPPHGRLKMKGSLVFPSNPMIALKGGSKARPVHVVDSFETLVVFSEWAWVGDEKSNPGDIPMPLPNFLKRKREQAADLWDEQVAGGVVKSSQRGRQTKLAFRPKARPSVAVEEDEVEEVMVARDDLDSVSDAPISLEESNSETWKNEALGEHVEEGAVRVNPSRRLRKKINYSQLFDDEDEESNGDGKEGTDGVSKERSDSQVSSFADVEDLG